MTKIIDYRDKGDHKHIRVLNDRDIDDPKVLEQLAIEEGASEFHERKTDEVHKI